MNTYARSSTPRASSNRRFAWLMAALSLLACALMLASLALGSSGISLIKGLSDIFSGRTDTAEYSIIVLLRLPRALAALLSGAALAVSGCIIQSVLGNPMASPNVIGIGSGAGLAVIITVAIAPALTALIPFSAFVGGIAAMLLIWFISERVGAGRVTVALIGLAVSSILTAAISAIRVIFPDSLYDSNAFSTGTLSGVGYSRLFPSSLIILASLALAILFSRRLDIISLGTDTAKSLGLSVRSSRFILFVLCALLAGSAVSIVGLVGFVGLLSPHMMRRLVGDVHIRLLPASALCGASLLLGCDLVARLAFAPYEIPVGIILSFIGGPFFIALVALDKRRDSL